MGKFRFERVRIDGGRWVFYRATSHNPLSANRKTAATILGCLSTAYSRWVAVSSAAVVCGMLAIGCSRTHYRTQADAVVSDAVGGATANPRFQLPGHSIAIDPRSRLFDPTDLDRPPRPPDDPDSHRLMECVDGHRGWPHWDKDGVLDDVEVNDYRSWLPYDDKGKVPLDMRGAVELSRLHSREFQQQLETLYLSAIDVTTERFAFYAQFYGGNSTQYLGLGTVFPGGPSSTISSTTNPFLTKAFTTGGTLVAGLANSIVWQFDGGRSTTNISFLNFALTQPLLQFAGRPKVLERLTRVERNLLANVRQYERYRQSFYLVTVTGNGAGASLSRIGGLTGGSGLSNFSGVGVGGFGGIGAISGLSSGGATGNTGIAPGGAGGFWFFLQTLQQLRNMRAQNSRLRDTWLQLTAAFDAGRLDNRFQVDLARQSYYQGQSALLGQITNYENGLDIYKVQQLDLPPDTPVEIRDPFFEPFNLIDPELTQLQDEIGDRLELLSAQQPGEPDLAKDPLTESLPGRVSQFLKEVTDDLASAIKELPNRKRALAELAEFPELKDNQFDNRALTPQALEQRISVLRRELPRVRDELTGLVQKFERLAHETELEPADIIRVEKEVLSQMSSVLVELSLIQARARLDRISLIPVRVTPKTAFQVALSQRPDWMNAKASLVDAWRLIRYNANALRTNLTVNISGELGTTSNNPINFSSNNGQLQAGVTVDPPLTRVIERNNFRISLIDYQQSRRQLMANRDVIHQDIRRQLRQMRLDQLNLELRRLAVDVAIMQTDVTRLKLIEPEKPSADGKIQAASPTVARDLVEALGNLVATQQALIFVWGDYEIQRRLLDYTMGTMRLDENGMWIDPGPISDDTLIERYYEGCPDPLKFDKTEEKSIFIELAPDELPPEPSEMDLPIDIDTPSPK